MSVRTIRAIQVLELIATPEAQAVLEGIAGGAPGLLQTKEAQASLNRLAKRASPFH
jgi:hypothetical protein